ncbi:MAG: cytochrome bc complex cytochrome b subunit, partial [Pseudomonadota bacterium]
LLPLILVALVFLHLVALHHVGSNNPDGIDIYDHVDEDGNPLDGIPFHPYYTVHDLVGVCGFLIIYLGIVFFAPTFGGIFLEKDNFAPANALQTPTDIVPLWYFTPFYSILRASTDSLLQYLSYGTVAVTLGILALSKFQLKTKIMVAVGAVLLIAGFQYGSGKAWGVILMAASIVMFFLLPWLDRSPVKSIRYRSWPFKVALAIFVVAFVILGWLGMNSPTDAKTALAQVCTVIYFAFFMLMPWFTSIGKTKPVPERVVFEPH